MNKSLFIFSVFILCAGVRVCAQSRHTTFFDNYDVGHYKLEIAIFPESKEISGTNTVTFRVIEKMAYMCFDAAPELNITGIYYRGKTLSSVRDSGTVCVQLPDSLQAGAIESIEISYTGRPRIAKNPPWDGGLVWKQGPEGLRAGVACEGIGASVWWPNKDRLYDEPDSADIILEHPDSLDCISNGRLMSKESLANFTRSHWKVSHPINNYNITFYLGHYAHLTGTYRSPTGDSLSLDYYVYGGNEETAKYHFKQVPIMLKCYEAHFGPYPFPRDGYKLVEAPYWGMEHQSAIAYGNNFENNEFGFDFIIVHESAHEYWGNSITCTDHAHMWIHEAFATYSELLLLECKRDKATAEQYLHTKTELIQNKVPVQGPEGIRYDAPDADMYYKGAWMLHGIRHTMGDSLFLQTVKNFYTRYKISHVTADTVINYFVAAGSERLRPIFHSYLTKPSIPVLEYKVKGNTLQYRWKSEAADFVMPADLSTGGSAKKIFPTSKWQKMSVSSDADLAPVHFLYRPEKTK